MTDDFSQPCYQGGSLEPSWFENVSGKRLREWLYEYLFSNLHNGSPSDSIVHLLNDLPPGEEVRDKIGRAINEILNKYPEYFDEIEKSKFSIQKYGLSELLRICVACQVPESSTWFLDRLSDFSDATDESKIASWLQLGLTTQLLIAAGKQMPATRSKPAEGYWKALLKNPKFTTIALVGFGQKFRERATQLPVWWETYSYDDKLTTLNNFIRSGERQLGETDSTQVITDSTQVIREIGSKWDRKLKYEINKIFKEHQRITPFFLQGTVRNLDPLQVTETGLIAAKKAVEERMTDPFFNATQSPWRENAIIQLIFNDAYLTSERLKKFSNDTINVIHSWLNENNIEYENVPSHHFAEASGEITTETHKVIFAFPFLLPSKKSNQERMSVLHYGWHTRFGLVVHKDNRYLKKLILKKNSANNHVIEPISFDDIMKPLFKTPANGLIFGPKNYSILDVVRQSFRDSQSLADMTISDDRIEGLPIRESFISESSQFTDDSNKLISVYVFDLGDMESIGNWIKKNKDYYIINIEHNTAIPVGVGVSIYAAPVILDNNWFDLHKRITSLIDSSVKYELKEIGINVDENIKTLDSVITLQAKSE